MDDFRKGIYKAILSEITQAEILKAPSPVKSLLDESMILNSEMLELSDEAVELAEIYLKRQIVTRKFLGDALNIALASISEADVLVSWNFKHIFHLDKIKHLTR